MLKQDLENPAGVPVTTVEWPSGASSIREQLTVDLLEILNETAKLFEVNQNVSFQPTNDGIETVYHMLASFAEKYAADDFFDR